MNVISPTQAHDPGCKRLLKWPADTTTTAFFSPDGVYRYMLQQVWDPSLPLLMWLLMNPSGAGLEFGDSTLLKTGSLSRRHGFGGQMIANVCAYRATDNARLLTVSDPVGPDNLMHIIVMAATAGRIIIGHGKLPGALQRHAKAAVDVLRERGHTLHVLRLSNDGTPVHPLARGKGFIPLDIVPQIWYPA
jgi:hypothetical protein